MDLDEIMKNMNTHWKFVYIRIVAALFLAGFATFSLLYCVQPFLPLFAKEFAVSPAVSSLPLSLSTASLAIAIFLASALSENYGRRSLMFLSMVAASICNLIASMASDWSFLLGIRIIEGIALGGVPAVAMAYLSEEMAPQALGLAMGIYIAGTAFGGMMGRLGSGMLAEYYSWRVAMAVIGITGIIAAIGFRLLLPQSVHFTPQKSFKWRYHISAWQKHVCHTTLPLVFLCGFLVMGVFVAIYNYVAFRLSSAPYHLTQAQIGWIFIVYLFGIVISPLAGMLTKYLERHYILMLGILCMATGIGLTLLSALPGILTGIAVLTIGFFIAHSTASSWVGLMAGFAKGHASSLYLLSYYLGSSIIGFSAGWFWEMSGWDGVVVFNLLLLGVAGIATLRLGFWRLKAGSSTRG